MGLSPIKSKIPAESLHDVDIVMFDKIIILIDIRIFVAILAITAITAGNQGNHGTPIKITHKN